MLTADLLRLGHRPKRLGAPRLPQKRAPRVHLHHLRLLLTEWFPSLR